MREGHSEIVVDGYNLMYKLYSVSSSSSLDILRQKTEKQLLIFQHETKCPVTVVYDGKSAYRESAFGAPLHIVFTPASKSADQWIIDYVKSLNTQVKLVTIVSSDDEIRRYARAFGAQCIKSEEFAIQLKNSGRTLPLQNKQIRPEHLSMKEKKFNEKLLSNQEVNRWMKLFTHDKP